MKPVCTLATAVVILCTASSAADETGSALDQLDAREAVRLGNAELTNGNAAAALAAYAHARDLRPDAFEIPFVEGLGHYALEDYEAARSSFTAASLAKDEALGDDALYSIGTTYHAEALRSQDDPKLALSKLESAMQRYMEVLANQPDHEAARDAVVKAAALRRNIQQMMEQQQQQQEQDRSQPDNEQDNQDQQEKGDSQEQSEEQQGEPQPQEQESQSADDQQQSAQQEQQGEDRTSPSSAEDRSDDEQEQSSSAESQDEDSTSAEQAQRRLREMMQAVRERDKLRRREAQPMRIEPVEKDW